jgi:RND family efflux transporter MFP subunit
MNAYVRVLVLPALIIGACSPHEEQASIKASGDQVAGAVHMVRAVAAPEILNAPAVAEPYASATLSTKLMGSIVAVHVQEGDHVRAGQPLATVDSRDLTAKSAQIAAGIAEAEAIEQEAGLHLQRIQTLFAEDAAPRAQLDAAETGLARARAGVRAAHAGSAELEATRGYSIVRAPFDGVITRRMVDVGAFAAPGTPLLTIQNSRRLRVTGTAAPQAVRGLKRGSRVHVEIEGEATTGAVEAVVPTAGNLYRVNVIVENADGRFMPGSAATLALQQMQDRLTIRVPAAAIQRSGDLAGVYVRSGVNTILRWVQLGATTENEVEILTGLREGEQIIIPANAAAASRRAE